MQFRTAESFQKPLELDQTLSEKGVYIRKNIKEVEYEYEDTNTQTKQTRTKFVYEEAYLSNEEYAEYKRIQAYTEQVELKRESQIIDEYTLELIESGVL